MPMAWWHVHRRAAHRGAGRCGGQQGRQVGLWLCLRPSSVRDVWASPSVLLIHCSFVLKSCSLHF